MMNRCLVVAVAVFAVVFGLTSPVLAREDSFGAHLSAVQEVPPVFSEGHGFFFASFDDTEDELVYSMVYFGLTSNVTQAHIHFGTPGINGGIMAFLCSNLLGSPAGIPPCPNGPGFHSVAGTITAANIVGTAASQGVAAGNFEAFLEAVAEGAAYANIHTENYPAGEIRGPLGH